MIVFEKPFSASGARFLSWGRGFQSRRGRQIFARIVSASSADAVRCQGSKSHDFG